MIKKVKKIFLSFVLALLALMLIGILVIFCAFSFTVQKVETEEYSISIPHSYLESDDEENCYRKMFSENEIRITYQKFEDIPKDEDGNRIDKEECYWDYLVSVDAKRILMDGEKTELGGYTLWEYGYGVISKGKFACAVYIYKADDAFWCIRFSALEEDFDDLRKDIPKIIDSFGVKD